MKEDLFIHVDYFSQTVARIQANITSTTCFILTVPSYMLSTSSMRTINSS